MCKRASCACVHLEKMPRFITGDELGNLKAYVSTNDGDSTKVQCSELLVETNKQKSIQKLAVAKSTVRNILYILELKDVLMRSN